MIFILSKALEGEMRYLAILGVFFLCLRARNFEFTKTTSLVNRFWQPTTTYFTVWRTQHLTLSLSGTCFDFAGCGFACEEMCYVAISK